MRRTEYSENFLGEFVSRPLVREFVFLSPQFQKGKPDKELCDLLLILRKQAMPIQMKCQEDLLIEHFTDPVLLADFPVEYEGVPLSYFTVNDFLNVVNELRSFTE